MDTARKSGSDPTVYLVGAGPGAPDLLTLRAARLLAEADIVFHDALVHPETLALALHAEKIAVGKRCGRHSTAQQFINKRLFDAARRYRVTHGLNCSSFFRREAVFSASPRLLNRPTCTR